MSTEKPRARALGVPFEGAPGPLNAITDVAGVEVGHTTLITGEGPLRVGVGPVRTGVTAILPRGKTSSDPVMAGWFSLNGNGEMTGTAWVEESGFLEGPVLLTNTHSVGVVRDAVIAWRIERGVFATGWALPVVAETWDGGLNDINGFHVRPEHVFAALDGAAPGPVPEGNVGGGTGMICHGFKGGIGTSSRRVETGADPYTLGVLAQCNYGARRQLRIAGVPVGAEIREDEPAPTPAGSIIAIVATDAPLLPHQLERIARRVALGIGRMGGVAADGSGDIFLAFSTANAGAGPAGSRSAPATEATSTGSIGAAPGAGDATVRPLVQLEMLPNALMNPLFDATVRATEEAIVNALVAAETMTGVGGRRVVALPHDRLREVLARYGRLVVSQP